MKNSLMAGILVTLLLPASCAQPPAETPSFGPSETPPTDETEPTKPTEATSEPELLKVVGQIGGPTQAVAMRGITPMLEPTCVSWSWMSLNGRYHVRWVAPSL